MQLIRFCKVLFPERKFPVDNENLDNVLIEQNPATLFKKAASEEELDSPFFVHHIQFLVDRINKRIELSRFEKKRFIGYYKNRLPRELELAKQVHRDNLSRLFQLIDLENFKSRWKIRNSFESIDAIIEFVWKELEAYYYALLNVYSGYVYSLEKQQFGELNDLFLSEVLASYIESSYYSDGVFSISNVDLFEKLHRCRSLNVIRYLTTLPPNESLPACYQLIEGIEKGADTELSKILKPRELEVLLKFLVEELEQQFKQKANFQYDFNKHDGQLREVHRYLFRGGFIDVDYKCFVSVFKGEGNYINWLGDQESLVIFFAILKKHTRILDEVPVNKFICCSFTINGSNVYCVNENLVKKVSEYSDGRRKKELYARLVKVLDLLPKESLVD